MREDSEQMTSAQVKKEIKTLEDDGVRLAYEVKQLSHSKDAGTRLFGFYELWKIQLFHLAEKCKDRDFELAIKKPDGVTSNIFMTTAFKQKMPHGPTRFGLTNEKFHPNKGFSHIERIVMDEESVAQIHAMEIGIDARIAALAVLRKSLQKDHAKPITIRIEVGDKKLRRMDKEDLVCTFGRGQGFNLVLKIARSPKPVAAKKLPGNSTQAKSTNVSRANEKIGTDLMLDRRKEFIVNPDRRSGYRVNEVYEVDFSK